MGKFVMYPSIEETLRSWVESIKALTFSDNFKSYEWEGEIAPNTEVRITHNLKRIPTRFIIVDASGTNQIIRGPTRPTVDLFYLKNASASATFSGKIVILP